MSLVTELKRRKVVRVAAVYVSAAFAAVEATGVLIDGFGLPDGALRVVAVVAAVGLPIALGLSWVFEVGGSGIRQTASVETEEGKAEMEAAAGLALLDGRTLVLAGALVIFGLGLGTGIFLRPTPPVIVDSGPSIAVLPFENRSTDEDAVFFVDGIHDELLNQLSRISALRVISRSSVMGYRDEPKSVREVGEELGVATVLEGGVQRAGDVVRISVQLVDTRTDAQLWAQSYEQALSPENLFAIQKDVSERISVALEAELSPAEAEAIGSVMTTNQDAYDLYMMANAAFSQDRWDAVDMLEEAVEIDPDFAVAWATLSMVYSAQYQFHEDRTAARLEMAKAAYERAFELSPDLPEAWRALGLWHYWGFRRYDEALSALERAESGLPSDPWVMSGQAAIMRRAGRIEAGIRSYEQAVAVNPLSTSPVSNLAVLYASTRNYEESARYVARTLSIDASNPQNFIERGSYALWQGGDTGPLREELDAMGHLEDWNGIISVERWRVEYFDGRHERAIAVLDSVGYEVLEYQTYFYPTDMLRGLSKLALGDEEGARANLTAARLLLETALEETPDEPRILSAYGRTLAALGETEPAVAAARRAVQVLGPDEDSLDGPANVWEAAATLSMLGFAGPAIEQLTVYFSNLGLWTPDGLRHHPHFRSLADDPRWAEVEAAYDAWLLRMERAGLR